LLACVPRLFEILHGALNSASESLPRLLFDLPAGCVKFSVGVLCGDASQYRQRERDEGPQKYDNHNCSKGQGSSGLRKCVRVCEHLSVSVCCVHVAQNRNSWCTLLCRSAFDHGAWQTAGSALKYDLPFTIILSRMTPVEASPQRRMAMAKAALISCLQGQSASLNTQ